MKSAADNAASRITVELIKGMLNATRREMEALIARTAMSPFIREKKDFFTAIDIFFKRVVVCQIL